MHGLLLLDKPAGLTSHDVVHRVRRHLGVRRVGHGGTLDPMATGLIPVAIGDATRLLEYLADGDKGYSATMRLGAATDSQDATGRIVRTGDWSGLDPAAVRRAIESMRGPIEQIPPMYSALKKNGVPLYKMARRGLEVEREPRQVVIRSIAMTDCSLPDVSFEAVCSKGTYIRTLAHDIGLLLGCGAHLTALRRFRHGPFEIASAVALADFETMSREVAADRLILPLDMLPEMPLVRLGSVASARLMNGVSPQLAETDATNLLPVGELVRLTDGTRLLAVAAYDPEGRAGKTGDFALTKVFVRQS